MYAVYKEKLTNEQPKGSHEMTQELSQNIQ